MKLPWQKLSGLLVGLSLGSATVPHYTAQSDTIAAELQIRNKLSLYALAVDSKNFGLLAEVFAETAVASFGSPPPNDILHGLAAVQAFIKAQVKGIITQHTISTAVVDFI